MNRPFPINCQKSKSPVQPSSNRKFYKNFLTFATSHIMQKSSKRSSSKKLTPTINLPLQHTHEPKKVSNPLRPNMPNPVQKLMQTLTRALIIQPNKSFPPYKSN
ncbi:hypothetical protein KC19_4G174900 [Ceratodon purpureus]|uniref:Uncharacterized protein n=1 Tax=Ceratodon purpureus TaxID=3225 RepID=A0A8T0IBT7_CERPU|nr:hypothetical protein KC19_4G174900 [Ceratodon purpureus]